MRIQYAEPQAFIDALAKKLEEEEAIAPPAWASYVKTGVSRERPPIQKNWWYVRAAAILRRVALRGPIGTQKLRTHFGGRKNRGHKPDKSFRGSGNIIRTILQQLEAAELVKQDSAGAHKGRIVTAKGHSLLDKTSNEVVK